MFAGVSRPGLRCVKRGNGKLGFVTAPIHLAVVDDEPDITLLLANYLKGHGFRVSPLHTGAAR